MRFWRSRLELGVLLLTLTEGTTIFAQPGHPSRTVRIEIGVTDSPAELPLLEICAVPGNRRVVLTTMWDDGPASSFPGGGDLRMAQTLQTNGWKGTFGWELWSGALVDTAAMVDTGMEVCSHTATHPLLSTRTENDIFWELLASKIYLSALTQGPVVSYDDAFLCHDPSIDRQIQLAGFLFGRGGFGTFSLLETSRGLLAPSTWVAETGTNACRQALASIYSASPEGTVQSFSGHAYPPEFSESFYAEFIPLLHDFGQRPDTWYATAAEIGSQMLLLNAAELGPAQIESRAIRYSLQFGPLPRDVIALPLTLRLVGSPEQLNKITSITVDGDTVATRTANGVVLFEVAPFTNDLRAQVVSTELASSTNPIVQAALHWLPAMADPDLSAAWSWSESNGIYQVSVCASNRGVGVLTSLALEWLCSSIWNVSAQGSVPSVLAPGAGFQVGCTISPMAGRNTGGWTAFAGRIDYVNRSTPKTHYLYRDLLLPITPELKQMFPAPNCQVAGLAGDTSNLTSILRQAEGHWARLQYDASDRPDMLNLAPVFYPANLLVPGVRVVRAYILSDRAQGGLLKVRQQYRLSGLRFWMNESELSLSNGTYDFTLGQGLNRFLLVCDAASGIEQSYSWPITVIGLETAFLQPDGVTPLTGVMFTARPDLCLDAAVPATATGSWCLTCTTIPGRTYRLEFTSDLSTPVWAAFGADHVADGDTLTVSIVSTNSSRGFFRALRLN